MPKRTNYNNLESLCRMNGRYVTGSPFLMNAGFTLVEIMVVIVLLAIGAAMTLPFVASASSSQAMAAAEMIAADLEYAKSLAITEGQYYGAEFNTSTEAYRLIDQVGNTVKNPVNVTQDYAFSFPGSRLGKVDVVSVDFRASSTIKFDPLGSSYNGDSPALALEDTGKIELSAAGLTKEIWVSAVTGIISIH
ncbi:Tfp pilus assembly protein FimT/FimU [Planctomycetota bacterium]